MRKGKGKKFYEMQPGEAANLDPGIRIFADNASMFELTLYINDGDQVNLWRAWRAARACGDISPKILTALMPHLDAIASSKMGSNRADQRAIRNHMLLDYYHELKLHPGGKLSKGERLKLLNRLHRRWGRSPKAIDLLIMKHEGRLGKAKGQPDDAVLAFEVWSRAK